MKRLTVVLVVLISVVLLLASCSGAQQTTQTTQPSVPPSTPPRTVPTTTAVSVEKPQYGGQILLGLSTNVVDFDEIYGFFGPPELNTIQMTNERLFTGDWTKGPAGSGETTWSAVRTQFETGAVAESWDFSQLPQQGMMTFKIRQGDHFALNSASEASRLVGGRQITADDVVFTLKQGFTNPRSYLYGAYPGLRSANITAPDKNTVVFQTTPDQAANALLRVTECLSIVPPEVVQKYGNMTD